MLPDRLSVWVLVIGRGDVASLHTAYSNNSGTSFAEAPWSLQPVEHKIWRWHGNAYPYVHVRLPLRWVAIVGVVLMWFFKLPCTWSNVACCLGSMRVPSRIGSLARSPSCKGSVCDCVWRYAALSLWAVLDMLQQLWSYSKTTTKRLGYLFM